MTEKIPQRKDRYKITIYSDKIRCDADNFALFFKAETKLVSDIGNDWKNIVFETMDGEKIRAVINKWEPDRQHMIANIFLKHLDSKNDTEIVVYDGAEPNDFIAMEGSKDADMMWQELNEIQKHGGYQNA